MTFWETSFLAKDSCDGVICVGGRESVSGEIGIFCERGLIVCVETVTYDEVSFFAGSGSVFFETLILICYDLYGVCHRFWTCLSFYWRGTWSGSSSSLASPFPLSPSPLQGPSLLPWGLA